MNMHRATIEFRDFIAEDPEKRKPIFQKLGEVFEKHGELNYGRMLQNSREKVFGKLILPERHAGKLIPFTAKVCDDPEWEKKHQAKAL